jgi:hypothetical protein
MEQATCTRHRLGNYLTTGGSMKLNKEELGRPILAVAGYLLLLPVSAIAYLIKQHSKS